MKGNLGKRLLVMALSLIVLTGGVLMSGCGQGSSKITEEELREVISSERLVTGSPVTLENSPVYEEQTAAVAAPENELEAHETGVTEDTLTVSRDEKYGGGQFISKLFTEGLSRAAYGEEFVLFQQYIVENGCTAETLNKLAKAVFTSEAFASFEMNRVETAFCLYRALLSRDPSEAEIMTVTFGEVEQKIDEITSGEEFAGLLKDIAFGPYSWRGSNDEMWTGDVVYTMSQFMKLLNDSEDLTITLPQGALVLVDASYTLPVGCTVRTEGNPDHYVRFARFLRTSAGVNTLNVVSDTVLQNVFADGNRGVLTESTAFGVSVTGDDNVVWGCRLGEGTAPIHTHPGSGYMYCGRNLITQYATNHWGSGGWADGIDMYAHHAIVEFNHVVDATDAGIVLFRAQSGGQNVVQNSIVRYNIVCNTGNSAYCGIDNEGVDMIGHEVADFAVVIYGNALYTSYVAHMHMGMTLSARPWTENYKKVSGVSFYNNYSPKGCFVNTAGGIIAEGADNGTVRGNQFEFRLADWSGNFMGERHYSVNSSSCEGGDFQQGYLDWSATNFISPVMDIETFDSYEVKIAFVYEDFQPIAAEKFAW